MFSSPVLPALSWCPTEPLERVEWRGLESHVKWKRKVEGVKKKTEQVQRVTGEKAERGTESVREVGR